MSRPRGDDPFGWLRGDRPRPYPAKHRRDGTHWRNVIRRDPCAYCGVKANVQPHTRDHIVPKSAGGPDTVANLTASCARCNGAKGSLSLLHFLLSVCRDCGRSVATLADGRCQRCEKRNRRTLSE